MPNTPPDAVSSSLATFLCQEGDADGPPDGVSMLLSPRLGTPVWLGRLFNDVLDGLKAAYPQQDEAVGFWISRFDSLIFEMGVSPQEFATGLCLFSRSRFESLFSRTLASFGSEQLKSEWTAYSRFCNACIRWIEGNVAEDDVQVLHSTRNIGARRRLSDEIVNAPEQAYSLVFCETASQKTSSGRTDETALSRSNYATLLRDVNKPAIDEFTKVWQGFVLFFLVNSKRFELASSEFEHEYEGWKPAARRHAVMLERLVKFMRRFIDGYEKMPQVDATYGSLLLKYRPFLAVAKSCVAFLEKRVSELDCESEQSHAVRESWTSKYSVSLQRLSGLCDRVIVELYQRPCFANVDRLQQQQRLSVLSWTSRQSGAYVTHCLNYDLLTSDETLEKSLDKLRHLVEKLQKLKQKPTELGLPLAPYEYWERFLAGDLLSLRQHGWLANIDVRHAEPERRVGRIRER